MYVRCHRYDRRHVLLDEPNFSFNAAEEEEHILIYKGDTMRIIILTMLCGFMLVTTVSANLLSPAAVQIAASFVRQIDLKALDDAYDQASPLLRLTNERQQWMTMVERNQAILGKVEERTLTAVRAVKTFPNLPDGDYRLVQYTSRTAHKAEAKEILLLKHDNGEWQVCDYTIR